MNTPVTNRRSFIRNITFTGLGLTVPANRLFLKKKGGINIGLVTYQWGKDWDLPTVIRNCEASKVLGVELRTGHKHGVEVSLNAQQRTEVKKRFSDSPVTLLGYGSNEQFDSPDPALLKQNMDRTKELVKLCHDIGATGVKVKPNGFHEGVPHEKTIEQIGRSLNELARYADDWGQKIRLEVHGQETQELPNIRAILDVADHPNVVICWNCNPTDLQGKGFEYNFSLVKDRIGDTMHIHEMDIDNYPYKALMTHLKKMNYSGWTLLECSATDPDDKVAAMTHQRMLWERLVKG